MYYTGGGYPGGYSGAYPGYGSGPQLGTLRKQQIDTVFSMYPNTKMVQDGIYDIPVQIRPTNNIYLRISLNAQFPTSPPRLEVFPKGQVHPLLDQNCIVNDPQLQNWGPHSSLAMVVRSVVDYLMATPPTTRGAAGMSPPPASRYSGGMGGYGSGGIPPQQRSPSPCNSGPVGLTFPSLERYSSSELDEIVHNEERLERLLDEIPEVTSAKRRQSEIREKIEKCKIEQTSNAQDAQSAQSDVAAKQAELDDLKRRNAELMERKRAIEDRTKPSELAKALERNAKIADEECEDVLSKFLSGELNANQFAAQYKEKKVVYYTRTKKLEAFRKNGSFN